MNWQTVLSCDSVVLLLLFIVEFILFNIPIQCNNMVCFLGLLDLMKDIHFAAFFDLSMDHLSR